MSSMDSEAEAVNHTSTEVLRYADVAMYRAEHNAQADAGEPVTPKAHLVFMTPNPLRVMASAAELYAGRIVTDPAEVTSARAMSWFTDMSRTALQAPLEWIDLHFLLEGVTRGFTHQLVRQRTAVYVQESQRFAVKDNAALEVAYPPSILGLPDDHPWRRMWDDAVYAMHSMYTNLVNSGMPAEDARGLLPTNITTRVHYKTNLRNLGEHAGLRLCSQAQFEWKQVWAEMLRAIRAYGPEEDRWQQEVIADLFKPICYQTGRCEFRAATDRYCVIRERVETHFAKGEGPDKWDDIRQWEPLMEGSARLQPGGKHEG